MKSDTIFIVLLLSIFTGSCESDEMIGKCTHIPVRGVATIVAVEERAEYPDCGTGVLIRIDMTPDESIYAEKLRLQDVPILTLYPKRWIEAVGLTEGTQHRCIYYARGGPCPNYIVWDEIDEESIGDSCEVWAADSP